MKVEIEEVLEIVKKKQSKKAESLRRHSSAAKALRGKEDPESKRKRDLESQAMCEALSAFLALGEAYASISAMKSREEEQESNLRDYAMDKEEWERMKRLEAEAVPLRPDLLDNASEDDAVATTREAAELLLRGITGEEKSRG